MKSHQELNMSKVQYRNLINLALFLVDNKEMIQPKLDMGLFYICHSAVLPWRRDLTYECGTSACLLGWSPASKPILQADYLHETRSRDWLEYSKDVLGIRCAEHVSFEAVLNNTQFYAWNLLFASPHADDVTMGVERMFWFLEHGFASTNGRLKATTYTYKGKSHRIPGKTKWERFKNWVKNAPRQVCDDWEKTPACCITDGSRMEVHYPTTVRDGIPASSLLILDPYNEWQPNIEAWREKLKELDAELLPAAPAEKEYVQIPADCSLGLAA